MPDTLDIPEHFSLAVEHHRAGRLFEAETLYRRILAVQPSHVDALHLLGVIASQAGRHDLAASLIRQAIDLRPDFPDALMNLGTALCQAGQFADAMTAYRRVIALKPSSAEAHSNLGALLRQAGQIDEAIAACRQAIALRPNLPEAASNLGLALRDKGCVDEAVVAFQRAVALKPDSAEAHSNLALGLKDQGLLDDAIAAYRRAIAIRPNFAEAHSNLIYAMHFHRGCDPPAIAAELRRWSCQHAEPLATPCIVHRNSSDPDRPLRIGYVSADFRDHVVGRNLLPLFAHHDHGRFEITCYAHVGRPDALTEQFQRYADKWRRIGGLTDEAVAGLVREDGIDILVDLSLHTAGNRLLVFARKPAPVQVTFGGYPGSTGLSTIDYRLSDPYLDPAGGDESAYSERTIRLPASFWCYDPLDCRDIAVNPLPAISAGFITFGSLSNFCKINDEVLRLWAKVMLSVTGSRLLLLAAEGDHRRQTLELLGRERVDPQRVEFALPCRRRDYLSLYHGIDIGLDTFPYNGHTTSLDSHWMGVPVVTLVGRTPVGRGGWCQISNLGLTSLAGHTPEQFVLTAVDMASDLARLAELRATLRERMQASPLMDAPGFAQAIETAYRQMWRRWCTAARLG